MSRRIIITALILTLLSAVDAAFGRLRVFSLAETRLFPALRCSPFLLPLNLSTPQHAMARMPLIR